MDAGAVDPRWSAADPALAADIPVCAEPTERDDPADEGRLEGLDEA